jgi:excinuclease ABC subunit C
LTDTERQAWFPKASTIPKDPGVYRWYDANGRVLYVGKAKDLRSRLTSYFAKPESLHERTRRMVQGSSRLDWTIVNTEFEALQLEFTWIKQYSPPYNVQFRDDKSYPYLAISMGEEVPRVFVSRSKVNGKTKYFGPYTKAWAIRETLDSLAKVYPVRTCGNSEFKKANASGRPCLLADIGKCSAPCVGRISSEEHRKLVVRFSNFVSGSDLSHLAELRSKMVEAAESQNFELAAKLRDQQSALEAVAAKSAVVLEDNADADIFAFAMDGYTAAVSRFKVREGRIRGVQGWVADLELERNQPELFEYTLQNVFGADGEKPPREILSSGLPEEIDSLETWLSTIRGSKVKIRIAMRGDKRALTETAQKNAEHALAQYKLKRSNDFTSRSIALSNLQTALALPTIPLVIECYDVSHLSGTGIVASKVVFVDGKPKKELYRRYNIASATDDTDAMNQVLARRLGNSPSTEDLPNLIVVDGAKAQVNAAVNASKKAGVENLSIIGVAKRLEEVWQPDEDFPILLPRTSEELFLLQHLRDESHRFAIGHQRLKRNANIATVLEEIPGLGQKRSRIILKTFGSAARVKLATVEELADVPGIGLTLAQIIHQNLHN